MASAKRNLFLALVLVALGGLAYWSEFKHRPAKEAEEEKSKKIFPLKDVQVESYRIVAGGGNPAVELKCLDVAMKLCKPLDNSKWELVEPSKLRADDGNANSVVNSLNNLAVNETISLKEETPEKRAQLIKDYGLDPAARTTDAVKKVHVRTAQGETVAYFGGKHPINEGLFTILEKVPAGQKPTGKADEETVYITPAYFKSTFEHNLTYWRDKKIFTLAAHEVGAFTLENSKGKITGERKDGQWQLSSGGQQVPGDTENVDSLISAATGLSAREFVSESKTDAKGKEAIAGLKPVVTLTVKKAVSGAATTAAEKKATDEAPITLQLFEKSIKEKDKKEPTKKLYAVVSNVDPVFEIETFSKDRFEKTVNDLRMQKLITSMDRFGSKRLEFSGASIGAKPLVIAQKDGKWMIEGENVEADNEKIQNTLDKLSGNRIKEFLSGTAIPSGEDQGLRITLAADEKGSSKRSFVFWKSGDRLIARDLDSKRPVKEAYVVDKTIADALPLAAAGSSFYKKTAPVNAPSGSSSQTPTAAPAKSAATESKKK